MEYPVRCRIVDVTGEEVFPGLERRTPDESRPHIGKEGLAEWAEWADETVRITLDDGTVLRGSECWWEPITDSTPAQWGDLCSVPKGGAT